MADWLSQVAPTVDFLGHTNPVTYVADRVGTAASNAIADIGDKAGAHDWAKQTKERIAARDQEQKDISAKAIPAGIAVIGVAAGVSLPSSGTSAEGANMPHNPNGGSSSFSGGGSDLADAPSGLLAEFFKTLDRILGGGR